MDGFDKRKELHVDIWFIDIKARALLGIELSEWFRHSGMRLLAQARNDDASGFDG
jgi:hypothetical protein